MGLVNLLGGVGGKKPLPPYCKWLFSVFVSERAMAHCGSDEVLIVGGVGCRYCIILDKIIKGCLLVYPFEKLGLAVCIQCTVRNNFLESFR